MNKYLNENLLLDFNSSEIQAIIEVNWWKNLPKKERIHEIYGLVRAQTLFGFNEVDDLSTLKVLNEGYGQCLEYKLAPTELNYTWVEVLYKDQWLACEGILIDTPYLWAVQKKNDARTDNLICEK